MLYRQCTLCMSFWASWNQNWNEIGRVVAAAHGWIVNIYSSYHSLHQIENVTLLRIGSQPKKGGILSGIFFFPGSRNNFMESGRSRRMRAKNCFSVICKIVILSLPYGLSGASSLVIRRLTPNAHSAPGGKKSAHSSKNQIWGEICHGMNRSVPCTITQTNTSVFVCCREILLLLPHLFPATHTGAGVH